MKPACRYILLCTTSTRAGGGNHTALGHSSMYHGRVIVNILAHGIAYSTHSWFCHKQLRELDAADWVTLQKTEKNLKMQINLNIQEGLCSCRQFPHLNTQILLYMTINVL